MRRERGGKEKKETSRRTAACLNLIDEYNHGTEKKLFDDVQDFPEPPLLFVISVNPAVRLLIEMTSLCVSAYSLEISAFLM